MRRTVTAVVALLVPLVLLANAVRAVASDRFIRLEEKRMEAVDGLTEAQRVDLALVGLRAVRPGGDGRDVLRRERLPNGEPAFDAREVAHMDDVRRLLVRVRWAELAALGLVGALALVRPAVVRRGLRRGAAVTFALAAVTAVAVATNSVAFLTGFHVIFFDGDSWRFADDETLRRVYPDAFWRDTALILAAGAVAQAALLFAGTSLRLPGRPAGDRRAPANLQR